MNRPRAAPRVGFSQLVAAALGPHDEARLLPALHVQRPVPPLAAVQHAAAFHMRLCVHGVGSAPKHPAESQDRAAVLGSAAEPDVEGDVAPAMRGGVWWAVIVVMAGLAGAPPDYLNSAASQSRTGNRHFC